MLGRPQPIGGGMNRPSPNFLVDVALVLQLLRQVVVELGRAEAEFVDQARRQRSRVGDHHLLDVGLDLLAVVFEVRREHELIGPAEAAEPERLRVFDEIEALRELIFVGHVVLQREVVVGQSRTGNIRLGIELQQPSWRWGPAGSEESGCRETAGAVRGIADRTTGARKSLHCAWPRSACCTGPAAAGGAGTLRSWT